MVDLLRDTLASFGVDFFSFTDMPEPPRYVDFLFVKHNISDEWLKLYETRSYGKVDPGLRWCRRTMEPFLWSDAPYDAGEPTAAEFVGLMRELKLDRELVIPIPRARQRPGI